MGFSKKDIKNEFDFLSEFNFHIVDKVPSHKSIPYQNELISVKLHSNQSIYYDNGLIFIHIQNHRDLSLLISGDRTNPLFEKEWYAFACLIMFLKNDRNFETNYFREEMDNEQRKRLQNKYLAGLLQSNIERIQSFFKNEYDERKQELKMYISDEYRRLGLL